MADWLGPAISGGARIIGGLFDNAAREDENEANIQSREAENARRLAEAKTPFKDAYGSLISTTGVQTSPQGQQIVDALAGQSEFANKAQKSLNTSGYFGGPQDPGNPHRLDAVREDFKQADLRTQKAFRDRAVEEYFLQQGRQNGVGSSNYGSGLQKELNRWNAQYPSYTEDDLYASIMKRVGLPAQSAIQTYTGGQSAVPQPGANPIVAALNNQLAPAQTVPTSAGANIFAGIGNAADAYQAYEQQKKTDEYNRRILDAIERQLANQANTPINFNDPYTISYNA